MIAQTTTINWRPRSEAPKDFDCVYLLHWDGYLTDELEFVFLRKDGESFYWDAGGGRRIPDWDVLHWARLGTDVEFPKRPGQTGGS